MAVVWVPNISNIKKKPMKLCIVNPEVGCFLRFSPKTRSNPTRFLGEPLSMLSMFLAECS